MPNQPNYKHCCVIDSTGNYITFVLLLLEPDTNGNEQWQPQHYTLQDGEQLIDTLPPIGILKPKWNFGTASWQEAATPEEIAQTRPTPIRTEVIF